MATPVYKVLVDWDNDGDWTEAINDITGDVMQFNLSRGKNVKNQRANAGVFDCILNNTTNKYSFHKSSGALYGKLKPARPVMVRMGYPVDDFTGTNTDTLASRKPTTDDNFAAWAGDTSKFEIISNKLKANDTGYFESYLNIGTPDCHVGVDFTYGGAGADSKGGGLVLRWVDANNYLYVWTSTSTLYLSQFLSGSQSNLETATYGGTSPVIGFSSWSTGQTKYIEAECNGRQVSVWVDGHLYIHEASLNSAFDNATNFGVGGDPHANDRWEDFGGWRTMFTGVIDSLEPRPEPGKQYAFMRAIDDMERLKVFQCRSTTGNIDTTTGHCVDQILNAAKVSVTDSDHGAGANLIINKGERIIDTGATLAEDSTDDFKPISRNALTELYACQDEEGIGFYYIDGNGTHRFEAEAHRDSFPHTEDRAIWKDVRSGTPAETDIFYTHLEWNDGVALVENDIQYSYYKVEPAASLATVWRLGGNAANAVSLGEDRPLIAASGSESFIVELTNAYTSGWVTPAQTTDFTVYTTPVTGGVNITSDVVATIDATTIGYTEPIITLTNSNAANGYVRFLKVRATLHTGGSRTTARAEDATSANNYGVRRIKYASSFMNNWQAAKGQADKRLAKRKDPYQILKLTMPNGTKANLTEIIHRSISDRINVQSSNIGLTASVDYYIENFKMSVTDGGMDIKCIWELIAVTSLT